MSEKRTTAVFVISVAAELAGMHPQTLRIYERKGLIDPYRTPGGTRRYSQDDVPLEPPRILGTDHRFRIEPFHLRRDTDGIPGGVERLDEVHSAPPGNGPVPRRLRIEPKRGDGPESGDGNATHESERVVA